MCEADSITQSLVFLGSNLQELQIQSSTSPYLSFLAVTRRTSSPLYHKRTLPQHLSQVRCASTGFVNHTRLLKRKVLSVSAPTGQTSIIFPLMSLSTTFSM